MLLNEDILLRRDDKNISYLTLNRPKAHNALSIKLLEALINELDKIKNSPTRALIIGANGPSFCSGHDLKEIKENSNRKSYKKLFNLCSKLMLSIINLPIPVIARVHSTATAAGCQLVATCDLAVASDKSKFATPGVNIGLFCSTPMVALSRNVAKKQSMEMLLTGDMIDAKTAKLYGLVNRVVQEKDLNNEIDNLCNSIISKSSKTIAIGKKAFYKQAELGLEEAYDFTSKVMVENMLMHDAQEGVSAFIGKRTPEWEK